MKVIKKGKLTKDTNGGFLASGYVIDCEGESVDLFELPSILKKEEEKVVKK